MPERTHDCGALRASDVESTVTLEGWVSNYRDHGGVIFIDLRDRAGVTQVVFHPDDPEIHARADRLRHEDVIRVSGRCVHREEGMANPRLTTGEIEVLGSAMAVLAKSETPPFTPEEAGGTSEEQRLRHRYLDLRRPRMQEILRVRHRATKIIRDVFDEEGFLEVETPFLCRSTPEGARDFLVPARLHPGRFYALPQSPQLLKQLLMGSGVDRYMQIVRCFRDEDPRADRQAEFTQLDMEMSFATPDEVMGVTERCMRRLWQQILGVEIPPIERMGYHDAMERFGTDRPDLRFGLELVDVTDLAQQTDFNIFQQAISEGGAVKAFRAPGGASMARRETDALAEWVKPHGLGGLPVTKVQEGVLSTGIAKFLEPVDEALRQRLGAQDGDLICFGVRSSRRTVNTALGALRAKLAQDLGLVPEQAQRWVWITDFPLVEWNPEEKRWDTLHHPFTAPHPDDGEKLETDPGAVRSQAYDLVLNGAELGGGSIRIHDHGMQQRVLNLLGIEPDHAEEQFGFLLRALRHGTPPHGGIAMGLDRLIMHLTGASNIREVIAFPKTQNGADMLLGAPSEVTEGQLQELSLRVRTQTATSGQGT